MYANYMVLDEQEIYSIFFVKEDQRKLGNFNFNKLRYGKFWARVYWFIGYGLLDNDVLEIYLDVIKSVNLHLLSIIVQ